MIIGIIKNTRSYPRLQAPANIISTKTFNMGETLFSNPVKGLLIDISGVLKNANEAIPGSIDAIKKLQDSKFPFRLVTNESQITVKELVKELTKLGFNFKEDDILSPIPAVIKVVEDEGLKPFLMLRPNVKEEFNDIIQDNPNCVVIGDMDYGFDYKIMNEAFKKLITLDKPVILSLGKGKYYKGKDGLTLDVGPFTTALEYSIGVKARIIGKPDPSFFLAAVNDIGIKPEEAIMIGDDVASDVGGAQKAGIRGVLVRTGKYQPEDEKHEVKPNGIFNSFSEIVGLLLENQILTTSS